MVKFNIRESYLYSYWQSAKEKPVSISGGISLLLSILATFNYVFEWIEESTMNTFLLVIPVATFFIILLIYTPYAVYKKERDKSKKLQEIIEHGSQESLRDLRRQLRKPKVTSIASILQSLNRRLQELVDITIRNGIGEEKMRLAEKDLIESYGLDKNKYTDDYLTKDKMKSLDGMLKRKLNVKSLDDLLGFFFRVIGVLENNGIGISAITSNDKEYESLIQQLERQRGNISSSRLTTAIDNYLWWSRGFASMSLILSDVKPVMKEIPAKTAAMVSILPDSTDTVMQILLANVNKYIEDYLLGT
jgi:hypothetical protein